MPKDKIFNLYIPRIEGKEKRKTKPSKSGVLGVEGMKRETIEKLLSPFASAEGVLKNQSQQNARMITKLDFFEDGLSGGEGSSERRKKLALHFELPETLTSDALLEALNLLVGYEDYKKALYELFL